MNVKRLEVLVDRPLVPRVVAAARACGITNFHLVPTLGGLGEHGEWVDDALSGATSKILFVTIVNATVAIRLADQLTPLLDSHDLLLATSDVDVVRGSLF